MGRVVTTEVLYPFNSMAVESAIFVELLRKLKIESPHLKLWDDLEVYHFQAEPIRAWMHDHDISYDLAVRDFSLHHVSVVFCNPDQAMLFKLTWM